MTDNYKCESCAINCLDWDKCENADMKNTVRHSWLAPAILCSIVLVIAFGAIICCIMKAIG